jgi:hypothetical protein
MKRFTEAEQKRIAAVELYTKLGVSDECIRIHAKRLGIHSYKTRMYLTKEETLSILKLMYNPKTIDVDKLFDKAKQYYEPLDNEEWIEIPGYSGFYASSLGRIRRGYGILNYRDNGNGYKMVQLIAGKNTYVHRIICTAFHGIPTIPNMQAAHINGKRADNRACNIKWMSALENIHDKRNHGTNGTKITKEQVLEIRELATRKKYKYIAAIYGIHVSTVSNIIAGKTWVWVS